MLRYQLRRFQFGTQDVFTCPAAAENSLYSYYLPHRPAGPQNIVPVGVILEATPISAQISFEFEQTRLLKIAGLERPRMSIEGVIITNLTLPPTWAV